MSQTTLTRGLPQARNLVLLLLAGPLIWSVYHIVGYLLVEVACRTGILAGRILGLSALWWILIVLTVAALLATLYAGFLAYRNWQDTRTISTEVEEADLVKGRTRFLALSGLLLNSLFAVIILLDGIPALVLRLCG